MTNVLLAVPYSYNISFALLCVLQASKVEIWPFVLVAGGVGVGDSLFGSEADYLRTKGIAGIMKGSNLVEYILEEYLKGTRTTGNETEDLKKKLAEKEAALRDLHSQDIVIAGLKNELEMVKTQVKTLDEKLAIYTGLNNDLKADKENLQKRLSE